ncbi:MAG TPA: polyprenyl diphosphate synthase [Anaeromyxobacteraceae bacterium]|nr:polyprenyl diphosphate synthase [Anaeromyxobacteraceae bacterium]
MAERTLAETLREKVRARPLPRHVAIIMDGNGRWAEARGLPRLAGHREGSESVRAVTREARRIALEALTLYAFSAQNWSRPPDEVQGLMELLAEYLDSERAEIMDNDIRLHAIGELHRLPDFVNERLERMQRESQRNRGMTLTLALSYDAREDVAQAARRAAAEGAPIDQAAIDARLWTAGLPELDLLVRTSGERRISNFLLWQSAYAEFAFPEVLWPDFRELEFLQVVSDFQSRERRFGLTGAQVAARDRA